MLAPAFLDGALLEQEPLLTHYFNLLVSKLKQRIDGSERGHVDMMAYYNFVTFDIIGQALLTLSPRDNLIWSSDLVLGESFGALEGEKYHTWIRFVSLAQTRLALIVSCRNVFESVKMLGVIRFALNYPAIGVAFGVLQKVVPSIASKRKQHMMFTESKIKKRLDLKTYRKDFITYVKLRSHVLGCVLTHALDTS